MRFCFFAVVGLFLAPFFVYAQDLPSEEFLVEIPPDRTIETILPEKAPERIVELLWLDAFKNVCKDELTLSLSAVQVHPDVPVRVRMRIKRKCNKQASKAPIPQKADIVIRSNSKRGNINETIVPEGSTFSFLHTFPTTGLYHVSVINYYSAEETHTVSLDVHVKEKEVVMIPEVVE